MKKLITWLTVILIVLVAAGGGYYYFSGKQSTTGSTTTGLTEQIAVSRGTVEKSVSPSGEVYAVQSEDLNFDVPQGTISVLNVKAGQQVKKGDVIAELDPAALQRSVDQAQANVTTAEQNLADAQEQATELELQQARLAVTQAQLSLESARKSKQDLQDPDLTSLASAIDKAKYDLQSAQLNLSLTKVSATVNKNIRDLQYSVDWYQRYIAGLGTSDGSSETSTSSENTTASAPGPGGGGRKTQNMTLEQAQTASVEAQQQLAAAQLSASTSLSSAEQRVTQAQEAVATAQEKYSEAKKGATATQLTQADKTIAQAELQVAQAQDSLDTLTQGVDAKKVELAQAQLDAAKATLSQGQATLAAAVMAAPFDGTIMSVKVEVGDEVNSSKTIVSLSNLKNLQVRGYVDETDILGVAVGQAVKISFDAISGKTFEGKVLEVPVQGALSNNVVTYEVPIAFENAGQTAIKPGMTANISIVTASTQNVLVLPVYAVESTTDGSTVSLADATAGGSTTVPVVTGITDGVYVEIVSGLNEGDTVLAAFQSTSSTTGTTQRQGQNQQFFIGGFGGMR